MKKNIKLTLVLCMIICIFIYHKEVITSIQNATILFQKNIFPSLFPFMVISPFLINYGFLNIIKSLIGPWMKKIFHLQESAAYVFVMSILSGFPGSAIYAKELYTQNIISKNDIEKLILFCHFSNPIFILTIVEDKPLLILFVSYIINILIGILTRNNFKNTSLDKSIRNHDNNFFKLFSDSIKNSMENSLFILGVVVFFFMITAIIDTPIANIFLEISQGLNYLKSINLPLKYQAALTGALISFGGFSVHLQTYGILSDLNFNYLKYLKTRLFHALLTFLIIFIIY